MCGVAKSPETTNDTATGYVLEVKTQMESKEDDILSVLRGHVGDLSDGKIEKLARNH
jgi:hypothetical protein